MINVSKNDFEEGNYDTTGVVLAEGVGEDGVVESYNIYYLTDEKGAASNLRIKKDTKKQDAALAAHNKKHTRLIDIDVLGMGVGSYGNHKKDLDKVSEAEYLGLSRKIKCNSVRTIHNPAQIAQIKNKMILRWSEIEDAQDDAIDAIEAATTIEELDAIDVNLGL